MLLDYFDQIVSRAEDVGKLNAAILQLAVQGKLVAQDPNDEPASELLKRIEAEKQRLIEEKKIRKSKPLPEIGDEERPFALPDGWEWVRLADIIQISSGKNLTSKNMVSEGGIPVYGGNGVTGYHNDFNVDKRTVVIGRVGYYCGSIHLTESKAWVTDNAFITRFSEENIYREWVHSHSMTL